jgi:MerR family transcriptional regulator, light-induced transcriptional regulator
MTDDYNTDSRHSHLSPTEALVESYVRAALNGNRAEALRVLQEEGISSGLSAAQLYIGVIQAGQYRIGQLWEDGEITVSQEHIATGISQLAIAQLYSMLTRGSEHGPRVVLTCVPGENHDMGPRILADFYEMAGFDVRFLGADVPIRDILDAVERYRADIVAVSATMSYNLPALRETVEALQDRFGEELLIAAGGQALQYSPEIVEELGISLFANDARELVQHSREALGLTKLDYEAC